MTDYEKWLVAQTTDYGQVVKPMKYKIGLFRFLRDFVGEEWAIEGRDWLDFGCATGEGMLFLHCFGASGVVGTDINKKKIEVAQNLGLDAREVDISMFVSVLDDEEARKFDCVLTSHTLEHVYRPSDTIKVLYNILKPHGRMFVCLPYVDTGDERAHCASREMGLREDDNGETLRRWFSAHGFETLRWMRDWYREAEIWLELEKR